MARGAPLYTIEKTIPLGPGERWDYVTYDPVDKRAYVAHGDHVTVVDVAKGKAIGDIGPFPGGTHGTAISHATGQGFTDDGKAGIVGVFDLATLKVKKTIPAAQDADGMVLDPVSGHVLVMDGDSGSVTVIDPKTDTAIATIAVGSGLEAGNVDGRGHLFVDGVDQHDIVAIDTATNKVIMRIGRWKPATGRTALPGRRRRRAHLRHLFQQGDGRGRREQRRCFRDAADRRVQRRRGVRCEAQTHSQRERRRAR